ncbi:MAG: PspA-associated protein PspAA [Nocardioides sp.]
MIVRILGEGQYDVADDALDRLNEYDSAVETAVEADDREAFTAALTTLLEGVRTVGVPHQVDSLDESDLILPPADASIDEVRALLSDDGLIPG